MTEITRLSDLPADLMPAAIAHCYAAIATNDLVSIVFEDAAVHLARLNVDQVEAYYRNGGRYQFKDPRSLL